jgi:hypothetical protein
MMLADCGCGHRIDFHAEDTLWCSVRGCVCEAFGTGEKCECGHWRNAHDDDEGLCVVGCDGRACTEPSEAMAQYVAAGY